VLVNSGGIFEATAYAGPCEVSRSTIVNYLDVLETTDVAHIVRPYSTRRASEIVSAPRVFAFDTGFVRHARGLSAARPEDFGGLWEHYVLNEVHACVPSLTPRYWRTKQQQEVDLVFDRRAAGLLAVECKWSEASIGRLRGLAAFMQVYPEAEPLIVVPWLRREYAVQVGSGEASVTDLAGLIRRAEKTNRAVPKPTTDD
jgi:uncharacterized protein